MRAAKTILAIAVALSGSLLVRSANACTTEASAEIAAPFCNKLVIYYGKSDGQAAFTAAMDTWLAHAPSWDYRFTNQSAWQFRVLDYASSGCGEELDAEACVARQPGIEQFHAEMYIADDADAGVWAHEVGHFLGHIGHASVSGTCADADYPTMVAGPDLPAGFDLSQLATLTDTDTGWASGPLEGASTIQPCPPPLWEFCSSETPKGAQGTWNTIRADRTGLSLAKDLPPEACPPECTLCPLAIIEHFSIEGSEAVWESSTEIDVAEYVVLGSEFGEGPWDIVGRVPAVGIGSYRLDLGGATSRCEHYQLLEVDTLAREYLRAETSTARGDAPSEATSYSEEQLRAYLGLLAAGRGDGGPQRRSGGSPDVVVFCPGEFVSDTTSYLADYWTQTRGLQVHVESLAGYPSQSEALRTAIDGAIESFAASGTQKFHLIGSANDVDEWPSPPNPITKPNLIPTHVTYVDGGPGAQETDYYGSDLPYADVSNPPDGLPDVVVTRWPCHDTTQLLSLCIKMQQNDGRRAGALPTPSAAMYVGDWEPFGTRDDAIALSAIVIESELQSGGAYTSTFHGGAYSDLLSRTDAAELFWSDNSADIAIAIGIESSIDNIAAVFRNREIAPFDVQALDSGAAPVMIAASCGTSTVPFVQDQTIVEDFLFHPVVPTYPSARVSRGPKLDSRALRTSQRSRQPENDG